MPRNINRLLVLPPLVLILLFNSAISLQAQTEVKVQILADAVNIHSGPGTIYPIIGTVSQPGKIILSGISADGAWFMFAYANGQGWIPADPAISKVISGSKDKLAVVDSDAPNAALNTMSNEQTSSGFSRAGLAALTGRRNCVNRSLVRPLQKIVTDIIAAADRFDNANPDSTIAALEGILNNYLRSSDISDCAPTQVLCEGEAGRDGCYFEFTTIIRSGLSEALIAALYTKADQSSSAQLHATRSTILINRWQTLAEEIYEGEYKRYTPTCVKVTASKLETGVHDAYAVLDGEFGAELDAKNYDQALKILERLRSDWAATGNLEACDPKLVKLTALMNTVLDESFIAALYLKFGNDAMFTKHARLGIKAAQYVNGLIGG